MGFLPAGLRFWTFKARPLQFGADSTPRACVTCGLVWVTVDAARLLRILREAGTEETRRQFENLDARSRPAV